MPRTWSNAKRPPVLSPAQRAKTRGPNSLNVYTILLIVATVWFFALIAYTMVRVIRHPITELPHINVQEPKED